MMGQLSSTPFPFPDVAMKIGLSLGIGLLVGLEREWAHKEVGVRSFAITALLGTLTALLSPALVVTALIGVLLMAVALNVQSLLKDRSLEITTSLALIVMLVQGALVGQGYFFTAAASAILMTMLLAWKTELARFAQALTPEEVRGAVLFAVLSFVIYPLLPDRAIDPWQLVNPRQAWLMVVIIAGIGFVNYVLLRLFSMRGLYFSALLGGLVNSTAAVAELASLFGGDEALIGTATAVLLITNVAMFVRNLLILGIFARSAIAIALIPLGVMALTTGIFAWAGRGKKNTQGTVRLSSPVSLKRVLKFATIFVALEIAGTVAERFFGDMGFLVVSLFGGLASSASTTATAAALVTAGKISPQMAGIATVLASVSSALINLPLVQQQTHHPKLMRKLAGASLLVVALGIAVLAAVEIANPLAEF